MPFALSFFRKSDQRQNVTLFGEELIVNVLLLLCLCEHHLSTIVWLGILEEELAGYIESIAYPSRIQVLKQGEIVKNFRPRRFTGTHC